jgi:hypothetical protein
MTTTTTSNADVLAAAINIAMARMAEATSELTEVGTEEHEWARDLWTYLPYRLGSGVSMLLYTGAKPTGFRGVSSKGDLMSHEVGEILDEARQQAGSYTDAQRVLTEKLVDSLEAALRGGEALRESIERGDHPDVWEALQGRYCEHGQRHHDTAAALRVAMYLAPREGAK